MALYALGDLHLGFQVRKPMEVFGKVWKHHERKIEKYVSQIVSPEDTLVLTGDHSWGRKLEECREDLDFIERLPGRKILLRGNHDMFWDAKKTKSLNEKFDGRLFFLQNNFVAYQDYALVGTKGFTFEGPFYLDGRGNITGWDLRQEEQAKKLVSREMMRLRESFGKPKKQDTGSSSCFCTTLPPIYWKKPHLLQRSRGNMVPLPLCIPIVMGSSGLPTVSAGNFRESAIYWYRGIF